MYQELDARVQDLSLNYEIYKEGELSEQELDKAYQSTLSFLEEIEFKNMMSKEEDKLNAILTINAGAGGTESQDWAEMLMRMYTMWAQKNGFKVHLLDEQPGEGVGIKSATLSIEGDFAYGYLKAESGVHRLVRVSPFDANAVGILRLRLYSFILKLMKRLRLKSILRIFKWIPIVQGEKGGKMSIR